MQRGCAGRRAIETGMNQKWLCPCPWGLCPTCPMAGPQADGGVWVLLHLLFAGGSCGMAVERKIRFILQKPLHKATPLQATAAKSRVCSNKQESQETSSAPLAASSVLFGLRKQIQGLGCGPPGAMLGRSRSRAALLTAPQGMAPFPSFLNLVSPSLIGLGRAFHVYPRYVLFPHVVKFTLILACSSQLQALVVAVPFQGVSDPAALGMWVASAFPGPVLCTAGHMDAAPGSRTHGCSSSQLSERSCQGRNHTEVVPCLSSPPMVQRSG